MKTCCSCGINVETAKKRNVSFHQFPLDDVSRQAWINAMDRENYMPSKTSVLCSLHFAENCLYYSIGGTQKQRRVVPGSIPTKFGFHTSNSTKETQSNDNSCNVGNPLSCTEVIPLRILQVNNEQNSEVEVSKISSKSKYATSSATCDHIQQEAEMYMVEAPTIPYENQCTARPSTLVAIQPESEIYMTEMPTISCKEQCATSSTIRPEIADEVDQIHQEECPTTRCKKFRRDSPRFVGDCEEDDVKSPRRAKRNWDLAMTEIRGLRKTVISLRQSKRRLQVRVENLKSMPSVLRKKKMISGEAEKLLVKCVPETLKHLLRNKKRNAAKLLRLILNTGRLLEANELILDYIQAVVGKGEEHFGSEKPLVATDSASWLPFNTLELLLLELKYASNEDDMYIKSYEQLKDTLNLYIRTVVRVSDDMIRIKMNSSEC